MSIDPAILDTVLGRLALLFLSGAGDDMTTARQAALHLLVAYKVETDEELNLAAEVISFGCHALQALSQAMEPDLPLNKVIRLRGSAVSLSREGHRNQRKLDQLQRDRRAAAALPVEAAAPLPTPPDAPAIGQAASVSAPARQAVKAEAAEAKTWTQAYHERQRDKRLAEAARKKHGHFASVPLQPSAAMPCPVMAAQAAAPGGTAGGP